jgi:hypothetical protein
MAAQDLARLADPRADRQRPRRFVRDLDDARVPLVQIRRVDQVGKDLLRGPRDIDVELEPGDRRIVPDSGRDLGPDV